MSIIDFKEIPDGDTWELFARDFLQELGFYIESPPNRGPDGGKDLLVTEEVKGKLHRYRFKWLVSCKHFAHSGNAVSENRHEKNILERVKGFNADGFIGFYSTLPSSGLNERLTQLRNNEEIKDYKIFDEKLIENHLLSLGFSQIMMRYLPESYKRSRPLHLVIDEYIPLKCDCCGKDILESLHEEQYSSLVGAVEKYTDDGKTEIVDMYFACKGECDREMQNRYKLQYGEPSGWKDISDIAIPGGFLQWIIATINRLHDPHYSYTKQAIKKEKQLIMAMSQKVFREATEKEKERLRLLMQLPPT